MFLDTFPDLDSYIRYIQANIQTKDFPLKILGVKKLPKGTSKGSYYSSALLAEAYRDIQNPDLVGTPVDTHFGKIGRYNSLLDPAKVFSKISKTKDGADVLLQGDILQFGFKNFPVKFNKAMILSHSCTTMNSTSILCCPVLDENEIDQHFVDFYKPGGNVSAIRGNLVDNFNVNFVGLPAINNGNSQKMASAICLPFIIPRDIIKDKIPSFRLTYRGLAYLQQRLAMFYFRDVQDSDDCRDM